MPRLIQFKRDAFGEALAAMLGEEDNTHPAFANLFRGRK
jgi:hypothetical protein